MTHRSITGDSQSTVATLFKETYRIPSARLEYWDYSSIGVYHVTICTKGKRCWFGDVEKSDEEPGAMMRLSDVGRIVEQCWMSIPDHYSNVTLDVHQVMPNHLHGILSIGAQVEHITLGIVVNQFKAACTKHIRRNGHGVFAWQPRFHDHIIRNEEDFERIRLYIHGNPMKWSAGDNEDGW